MFILGKFVLLKDLMVINQKAMKEGLKFCVEVKISPRKVCIPCGHETILLTLIGISSGDQA